MVQWIRCVIPPSAPNTETSQKEDNKSEGTASSRCNVIRSDVDAHADGSATNLNHATHHTYYGPGELELYRHVQLQQDAKAAKLNVYYPGRWHRHSPRACFRVVFGDGFQLPFGGDDGCGNVDDTVVLKFRSNARIISARWLQQKKSCSLRWESNAALTENGTVYDHTLLLSSSVVDIDETEQLPEYSSESMLKLELDSQFPDMSDEVDIYGKLYPPPCVTLQTTYRGSQNQRESVLTLAADWGNTVWEWKCTTANAEVANEEWVPITMYWAYSADVADELESSPLTLPHQMELSHVDTIQPVRAIPLAEIEVEDTNCSVLYDFGKELLGKVCLTTSSATTDISNVQLRVGETLSEAMNDAEEHFEQSTELSYGNHGLVSAHLLAFRYVRIIFNNSNIPPDATVECRASMPPLAKCGFFSSSNDCPNSELDNQIWRSAADTLQLCIHNNFILDGIKRDRLPWAGDLAVSIMANAYSFRDEECIRWTLVVLGRCGIDRLYGSDDTANDTTSGYDATRAPVEESHVNGILDYSLWYIISHWLYQRYFEDASFLHQEWRVVEMRLVNLIQFCCDKDEGWLSMSEDDWVFIDWVSDINKNASLQTLWWWALECGTLMAEKMDLPENNTTKRLICDTQSRLEESFLAMQDIQNGYSRHAHILRVISGLYNRLDDKASEGDWSNPDSSIERWQVLAKIRKLQDASREALLGEELINVGTPYFKHLECLAICRLQDRYIALERIRRYWGGMLSSGATTFYEAYEEGETSEEVANYYDRPFGRSLCHVWGSGPVTLLPEIVLGLRPLSDGWNEWACDPLEDFVSTVSATTMTKFGLIEVHLNPTELRVSVPEGTTMLLMEKVYAAGSYCIPRNLFMSTETIHRWSMKYRGWQYHPEHVIPSNPKIPGYEDIQMVDVPTG